MHKSGRIDDSGLKWLIRGGGELLWPVWNRRNGGTIWNDDAIPFVTIHNGVYAAAIKSINRDGNRIEFESWYGKLQRESAKIGLTPMSLLSKTVQPFIKTVAGRQYELNAQLDGVRKDFGNFLYDLNLESDAIHNRQLVLAEAVVNAVVHGSGNDPRKKRCLWSER